jgi:hypothetical protein
MFCQLRFVGFCHLPRNYDANLKNFGIKFIFCMKCVRWVSLKHFVCETFIVREEFSEIIAYMYLDLYAKWPTFESDFNQTYVVWPNFDKIARIWFKWKIIQWQANCATRIDRHDEANELFMAALGTRLKVTKMLFVNLVIIQAYIYI